MLCSVYRTQCVGFVITIVQVSVGVGVGSEKEQPRRLSVDCISCAKNSELLPYPPKGRVGFRLLEESWLLSYKKWFTYLNVGV